MQSIRKCLLLALAWGSLNLSLLAEKADPTGTWKWTFTTPNGDTRDASLKLKLDGEKLTGSMSGRNGTDIAIQDATLKGDEITFKVVRERDGNQFTSKYNGKVEGNTIKGKIESTFNGENRTREWEAKKEGGSAAPASSNVTGTYKYTITRPDGQTFEPTLKLKQEGETITGSVKFGDNETEIKNGKVGADGISFEVIRERNGNTVTSKYKAKPDGDSLKGKISSNWGGEDRTFDFEAKKTKE